MALHRPPGGRGPLERTPRADPDPGALVAAAGRSAAPRDRDGAAPEAGRGQTLVVSAPGAASEQLLGRVDDVRRRGGTILALGDDEELGSLAHDRLAIPSTLVSHDLAEHLVSLAARGGGGTRG